MINSSCPQCHSRAYKRNGYTRHGKQNHRCLDCGRQFSLEPYTFPINEQDVHLLKDLLGDNHVLKPYDF